MASFPKIGPPPLVVPRSGPTAPVGDDANGLPAPPGPLIGRGAEVARAVALLDETRLLTLTGPAGVGKSRLALAVAEAVRDATGTAAWLVDLASLADPALVIPAVADTLGVREVDDARLEARLRRFLREHPAVLLLDGFESVLAAAVPVERLLAECRGLTVLATSREPLRLRREHILPVAPLEVPDPTRVPAPDELARIPAVALFLARARAVAPGFAATEENGQAIAGICRRLDGLPLALELAAVRVRVAEPAAILADLRQRLTTLRWDAQDAPARHRTLRAAIGWSYDTLPPPERSLLRRLAVFEGGWTADAARAVAGAPEPMPDPLDGLASLVDKSLIATHRPGGEPRFAILETVRAFALEALASADETDATRTRHLAHFLALAESAEVGLVGRDHAAWLRCLERDHDNLRAALREATARGEGEAALRLAGALFPFMVFGGHIPLGRGWLERLLSAHDGASPPVRAKATRAAGWLSGARGDHTRATTLLSEAATVYRRLDDAAGGALTSDYLAAVACCHSDGQAPTNDPGPGGAFARALGEVGARLRRRGAAERAARLLHESVALARQVGAGEVLRRSLDDLAAAWETIGDTAPAATARAEALLLNGGETHPRAGGTEAIAPGGPPPSLSPRERQVLRLVAAGLPDKEIARELGIVVRTVRVHVTSIFAKLAASNRAQAVAAAARLDLL